MSPKNPWKFPSACATLTLAALAGCSAEVVVPGSSDATSGGPGGGSSSGVGSGGAGGDCHFDPGAGLPEVILGNPTSGAFLAGALHLSVSLDEQPEHYLVLKLAYGAGYVVAQAPELDGPANLAPIDAHTGARVRGAGDSIAVEILDGADPAHPFKKSSMPVPGTVPPGFWKVFSVVDNHLFTCLTSPPDTEAVLMDVPLDGSGPPAPALTEGPYEHVCSGLSSADDAGFARGRVWLTWGYEYDLHIFDVSPKGATKTAEYNYNPDGIHHYGPVLAAGSDESRIVFDPGNDSEVFLYSVGSSVDWITHAYFGLAGPKRLLGVVGNVSYWATATGVRAYDVENLDAPKLLDFHADAAFGEGLAVLIAADETQLAVADSDGRLYVIPLDRSGAVEPLKTYLGAPPPAAGSCVGNP